MNPKQILRAMPRKLFRKILRDIALGALYCGGIREGAEMREGGLAISVACPLLRRGELK